MPRAALPAAALLLLIGAAAWWLLSEEPTALETAEVTAATTREQLDPAVLDEAPVADPQSAPAGDALVRDEIIHDAASPAYRETVAWFRGRLRLVEGALPATPRLAAAVSTDGFATEVGHSLHLTADDYSFELPATSTDARARISFPDFLEPVAARGGASLDGHDALLTAPAEGVEIDVRALPHLAVLFLHEPSGRPLARAYVTSALVQGGSSTSWGERLDDQGLLIFDARRRDRMEGAETLRFTVSWPPELGNSQAPPLACAELERLPQPLVLRFGSTAQLNFRVVDPQQRPIAGARLRLGDGYGAEVSTDEEGRASVLQSAPPTERLRVQAQGFLTVKELVTAASERLQEITLWPGSWILVVGAEAPPDGWNALDVSIVFDGKEDVSLLAPERFMTGQFTESSGGTGLTSNHDQLRYEHRTALSDQGRVRLDGIHVDVPATVTVTYHGAPLLLERVPIRPGDGEHRVEIPPLGELIPVRGRVTDLGGNAVVGAKVRAISDVGDHHGWGAGQIGAVETDERGEFDLGSFPQDAAFSVIVHAPGFGRKLLRHVVEARDSDSVGTVVLEPGLTLTVQVVGPDGAPFVAPPGSAGADYVPRLLLLGERIQPSAALGSAAWRMDDLPNAEMAVLLPGDHPFDEDEHLVHAAAGRVVLALSAQAVAWLTREDE